ncbi:MAG: TIGR04282 family arsenosugar biosynthesis glycosyltransferase [Proteobacteria bacterium]|nr:TIGR04282 family arsenosugar biosynthesis glycosyltransferase [Pseudomonadota bacterium]MBU1611566.1 TIGR04282 family arsenosugar biosynthesis glycosyltransferase [Pseudomonadota bacterium]
MKRCIIFFLKWPAPGEVKTRLAAQAGDEAAVGLARAMAEDMLDTFTWVEDTDILICATPKERLADFKDWLGEDRRYVAQRGPDLGRRMKNAFFTAFHQGYEQAVLLGSDIPDVHDDDIRQAFSHLENRQSCVLGPADDGGYWLIGFDAKGLMAEVFLEMDWGSDQVLKQTVRRLEFDERKVGYVTTRTDVDDLVDLRKVARGLKESSRTLKLARSVLD